MIIQTNIAYKDYEGNLLNNKTIEYATSYFQTWH